MQYKKAVQLCDKVLKKQSDLQSGRALKALALSRLQKMDEALALVEKLVTEQPSDEGTLQAMTMYFRESGQSKLHNRPVFITLSLALCKHTTHMYASLHSIHSLYSTHIPVCIQTDLSIVHDKLCTHFHLLQPRYSYLGL